VVQGDGREKVLVPLAGLGGSAEEPLQTPAVQSDFYRQTLDVHGPEDRNHQVCPVGPLRVHVLGHVVKWIGLQTTQTFVEMVCLLADTPYRLDPCNGSALE
jgi:hypothetical protein